MITDQELNAIEARANAATPGPWTNVDEYGGELRKGISSTRDASGYSAMVIYDEGGHSVADATFIAHARTDVPNLCRDNRKLQSDLDVALGALADIANMSKGEIADGVPQRKARRIYNSLKDLGPDERLP
jgi:hypothetical protein